MQQVGRSAAVPAVDLVESRSLPVAMRRRGVLAVVGAERVWVLHRRLLVRAGALLAVVVIVALGYQTRDGVANALGLVTDQAASGFSKAGLAIERVSLTGHSLTDEATLIAALGIHEGMSMVSFDARTARERLEALPTVVRASVRKVYPSELIVTITENQPVARWRIDGATFVIDDKGEQLAMVNGAGADLPLVIGTGAANDAAAIIRIIAGHSLLRERLVAMSRIADRRWDLIYDNGLRIMLPETGVEAAMQAIERFNASDDLLARDFEIIDMRVPGQLAARPADRSVAESGGAKS